MVIGRRVDEYISTNLTELRATAIDAFVEGDFLVAAGCRYTTFLSIGSPSISINRYMNNRNIVRLVRCNANQSRVYALASAQEIEVCKLDEEFGNKSLATLCGHSRSVLDLSWNPFNDNMLASSSEGDSVNFWDIRDSAKPVSELNTQFGASQAKFSPKMEYIVCTAHGSDIRIWDIRKPNYPWNQYTCHDGKIHALEWNPKEPNCFITSHYDGIVKVWDSNETSRTPTAVTINAWKIVFSPDAEEFATISLPSNNDMPNSVNIWRLSNKLPMEPSNFENCLTVKNDESDVIVDACWQNTNRKGVKYLFTLSKKRRLYRHPIIYEMMNEGRDEMPTPIAQSEVDVERDRLAMEPRIDEQEAFEINDLVLDHITDGPRIFSTSNRYHIPSESLPTSQISRLVSSGTPLIMSEWQRWITAPNVTGGDLLTVLEALRKHNTEGLYTTEINFQRAAIGFSYEHWAKCKKLQIEMRFHHSYLENGKVFVEVVQKDCPLTSDKAALFLQLLQTEADIQKRVPSSTIVLARVLQQIPKLVESMQVFTASMDVPNAQKFSGNLSSSSEDKVSKNNSDTNQTDPTIGSQKEEATANFTLSPYDEFVPAPRTAGCRFNGSGFLVTFGGIHSAALPRSLRLNKTSIGDMYGSSRKISFHTNETNVTDVPTVPTSRHRKLHSGKGSTHSAITEAKRESYRNYAEFFINHKANLQSTAHGARRDVVSQNAERYSISGGSPQSGFGYMTTVSSTTNMNNVYQRANPIKSSTKVLGTSPSPSIPSGTSRSYSLQNVNQSLRHRGNSITGTAGEEGSVIAEPMYSSLVTVYDATGLLPVSKELASKYKLLGSSALELCRHNRKAVQESNRKDLLIVWKLLEQCIQTAMKSENNETLSCINQCSDRMVESTHNRKSSKYSHNPFNTAWSHHPFGRGLVNSLLDHYSKLCDLQTAAVITCILGQHVHKSSPTSSRLPHSASNPFQSIPTETPTFERATTSPSNVSQGGLILKEIPSSNPESVLRKTANELKSMQLKIPRNSSYGSDVGNVSSSVGDEHNFPPRKISPSTLSTTTTYSAHETMNNSDSSATLTYADGIEAASKDSSKDKSESYEPNKNDYLLDPALTTRFEDVRLQYADILYRWRMYSKCTEVLKYCSSDTGIEQIDEVCFCVKCGQSLRNMKKCDKCKNPPITCAICDLPCRGATVTCPGCSHGGHLSHMTAWFQNQRACPLACGCDCKF